MQAFVPTILTTIMFAAAFLVVARREEGYTWWKALLVPLAGALTGILTGLGIEALPSGMRLASAWASLLLVAAVVAFGCRWMLMSWRDAALIGVGFVLMQFFVAYAVARML